MLLGQGDVPKVKSMAKLILMQRQLQLKVKGMPMVRSGLESVK